MLVNVDFVVTDVSSILVDRYNPHRPLFWDVERGPVPLSERVALWGKMVRERIDQGQIISPFLQRAATDLQERRRKARAVRNAKIR
jgi:hypothetical protein